jgi:hypothetical protein
VPCRLNRRDPLLRPRPRLKSSRLMRCPGCVARLRPAARLWRPRSARLHEQPPYIHYKHLWPPGQGEDRTASDLPSSLPAAISLACRRSGRTGVPRRRSRAPVASPRLAVWQRAFRGVVRMRIMPPARPFGRLPARGDQTSAQPFVRRTKPGMRVAGLDRERRTGSGPRATGGVG